MRHRLTRPTHHSRAQADAAVRSESNRAAVLCSDLITAAGKEAGMRAGRADNGRRPPGTEVARAVPGLTGGRSSPPGKGRHPARLDMDSGRLLVTLVPARSGRDVRQMAVHSVGLWWNRMNVLRDDNEVTPECRK